MKEKSIARIKLWNKEINSLIDVYKELIINFDFVLTECSMEKISFSNNNYIINFLYAYDRYQMEMNIEMPLALISFSDGYRTKTIAEIFEDKVCGVKFYEKLNELNKKTNDQSITYQIMIVEYIIPLLKNGTLI